MAIDSISLTFRNNNGGEQEIFYVRLGAFLEFLETDIMYQVETQNISTPLLKFNYDIESNIMYINADQTSLDPTICVLNRNINCLDSNFSQVNRSITHGKGELFDSQLLSTIPNTVYGRIMNIYISMSWVLTKLDELKNASTNKVVLVDLLNSLLSNINSALGGNVKLEATIDEITNTIIVRDSNPIPHLEQVIKILNSEGYNIPSQIALFDLYGYNNINGTGSASFIKNFSLTTEITPELSTMLTVGATANSEVVGENSTAFSKFNIGLVDRFKENITQGKSETESNGISELTNTITIGNNKYKFGETLKEAEYNAIKNKYAGTYLSYLKYIGKLSNNPGQFTLGEAETYKDVLTNILDYRQQWQQAYLNKQGKNTNIFSPSTGFIPFNLSLTMDGLSGMKIYNKFSVDTEFLPVNYSDNVEFLIKNIIHKIENNEWLVTIESIAISKGDEIYNNPLNLSKNQKTNTSIDQLKSFYSSTPDEDLWTLIAICVAENYIYYPQGISDVAQSIYNRLNAGTYGKTLKDIILSPGQYEPVFRNYKDWTNIVDRETAIIAYQNAKKISKEIASQHIDIGYNAITNPNLKLNSKQFVGSRTEFLAYSPKNKNAVGEIKRDKILYENKLVDVSNTFFWNYSGKSQLYDKGKLAALPPPKNIPQLIS